MNDDELFDETNVVGTPELAEAVGVTEADARAWARDHGVARIGNAFAWSREDADALIDDFEQESDDDDDQPRLEVVITSEPDDDEEDNDDEDEDE